MDPLSYKARLGAFRFYLVLCAFVVAGGMIGFGVKSLMVTSEQETLTMLAHSVDNLKAENDSLNRQLNILGVELEVARLANDKNQQLIQQELQSKISLRKQLSFYQKVMAPELEQEGFTIDSFNVASTHSDDYYRFTLVLMQFDKKRDTVKGRINLFVKGSLNGRPIEYNLGDLMASDDKTIDFSFRYFEVLKGEFKLPPGFMPEKVMVKSVLSKAKWGKRNLDRSFDWQLEQGARALANT